MGANRIITYGVEKDTGIVVSRVESEIACPVLNFAAIGMGGDGFEPGDFRGPNRWNLERIHIAALGTGWWGSIRWTKKIPLDLKNRHRAFWGFKALKEVTP